MTTDNEADLIDPVQWIEVAKEAHRFEYAADPTPLIYVAHPVAARKGEMLATCVKCKLERTYASDEAVNLHALCEHDAPVRHTGDAAAIVGYNVRQARKWWCWFSATLTEAAWTPPWAVGVEENGEADPRLIERGLRDDCVIVRRCDAIVLCGPRLSSGMLREANAAYEGGVAVFHVRSRAGVATETLWRRWEPDHG